MLNNPGWGVLCVHEEQKGRSHWVGTAREKKRVDKIRGSGSLQVLVPVSGSPHAGKKGDRIPFPDLSAIYSKGALRKWGRLYQLAHSEDWLTIKASFLTTRLLWGGGWGMGRVGITLPGWWMSPQRSRGSGTLSSKPPTLSSKVLSEFSSLSLFHEFFSFSWHPRNFLNFSGERDYTVFRGRNCIQCSFVTWVQHSV